MQNSISFIVFGKNVGEDLLNTIQTIESAMEAIPSLVFEINVVDDGSTNAINVLELRNRFKNVKHVLVLENSIGVSGAILSILSLCSYENVLPVPGHDMFSINAIQNVSILANQGQIIIGCRNNLSTQRPPIKKLASRILRDIYRHLTFYYVGDIHGLIMYKKQDLNKYLSIDGRHANAIDVVTPVLSKGGLLIQTIAPIKEGHDRRPSRRAKDSIPDPKNVFKVLKSLGNARTTFSKTKSNIQL